MCGLAADYAGRQLKDKAIAKIERALTWYYNKSAPEAFKFSSSFGPFVASCWQQSHAQTNPDTMTDAQLKAIRKFRRIDNILKALPLLTQRALASLYNWEYIVKYPLICTRFYGNKTGLLMFTTHFHDLNKLEDFLRKRQQSKLSQAEQLTSFQMGQEVEAMYQTIHQQYLDAETNEETI